MSASLTGVAEVAWGSLVARRALGGQGGVEVKASGAATATAARERATEVLKGSMRPGRAAQSAIASAAACTDKP